MSAQKIGNWIDDIERKVTKSNKIAAKGSKISVLDAVKLGRKGNSIVATVKKIIKEYETFEPTAADSEMMHGKMTNLLSLTEEQLNLLVANKARFESLKVGGLVKKNMAKTSEVSAQQEKVMLAKIPANLKPEAEKLAIRRKIAFDKATAAFAQSVGGEDQADGEDDSD